MMYAVDRIYAVEDVFDRVVDRILTCFDRKTLMTHILQGYDLSLNFFLR